MKRASLIGAISLVLMLVVSFFGYAPTLASDDTAVDSRCTTVVIGKNGTADGSLIVYHSEEVAANCSNRLEIVPRKDHEPGEMKDLVWEIIPEAPVTYKVIVNKYWPEAYPPGDWCNGVNEFGVMETGNAQLSKEDPLPTETGLGYSEMVQVTLERARTAREAIEVMGWLIDTYGTGGSWAECSYLYADQNEAWYLESSYTHWVAREIGDDEIYPIANRYLIGTDFDLASPDVVDYAVAQGWYDPSSGEPFSWKDVYGVPSRQTKVLYLRREARIAELLAPKWGAITLRDCFDAMRDHYEGTDLYYYPPHQAPSAQRPLCCNSQVSSQLYHLRSDLPPAIGAVMWQAYAPACSSVKIPIYAGITELPEVYTMLCSDEYDPVSAWWHFRTLSNNVDKDYANLNPFVRDAWYKFEEKEMKQVPKLEEEALRAYQSGDIEKMNKILTRYTNTMLIEAYNKANSLNNRVLAQLKGQ